jgi:3-oxoacyl-[acyl-carrier protein] reductase
MTPTLFKDWVLVTGGSRGIGHGVVAHLARCGRPIVFSYHSSRAEALEIESALTSDGRPCKAVQCNGRDPKQVAGLAAELLTTLGPPYALINNAGITRDALLSASTVDGWTDVLETNLGAAYYFCKEFAPAMMVRGGAVILQITSVSGLRGISGQSNYCASKAGLIGLTQALAVEMARFNVRVNAVAPGFIETDMLGKFQQEQLAGIKKAVPLRRLGQVKEVAGLVEYLLSDSAAYITGQTIVIDGGLIVAGKAG